MKQPKELGNTGTNRNKMYLVLNVTFSQNVIGVQGSSMVFLPHYYIQETWGL